MAKVDKGLFSKDASSVAYGDCPLCESPLVMKHKGKSSFLGCSKYPDCDFTQSVSTSDVVQLKEIPDSECPDCQSTLAVKKGRYGMFIGCTNFPNCHFISNNQTPQKQAEYAPVDCPKCKTGQLVKKQNRFGKYFYACNNYPSCKHVLNQQPVDVSCEECGKRPMVMTNQEGVYQCSDTMCGHKQSQG